MSVEHLVQMANDISNFFAAEPDRAQGVEGVRTHIRKFWTPRMREQIVAHYDAGGAGLSALAHDALAKLAEKQHA